MFCSSCGLSVAQGLSFCNHCGSKLNWEKVDNVNKSAEVKPESLVWGAIAVLVFGFVAITFLMMAMKMVGFDVGQILALTILSFLIMLMVESVFMWQLLHRKRGAEETDDTALSKGPALKELAAPQARVLTEAMPSVTEQTTRGLEPIYSEQNKNEESLFKSWRS